MEIIRHRRNTIAELQATPTSLGVEVDIRSYADRLITHHDPFIEGDSFEEWLASYNHGTLILNVKEEGLEGRLLELMGRHNIEKFFFLDQSFPFLLRTIREGESRCAVRVSEFEALATALNLAGMVDWAWIDCFTEFPLDLAAAEKLRSAGIKLCLVSPELQGRTSSEDIDAMRRLLTERGITIDAVCTKTPQRWQ